MTTEAPSTQSFLPPFGREFSPRDFILCELAVSVVQWSDVARPRQAQLFCNYAIQSLAIDALPRNCYLKDGDLLPFDVILCQPDEALEAFLRLYD